MLSISLSLRAECTHDVSEIVCKMLKNESISKFVSAYSCKPESAPFPDARFDVTFIATDKAGMHNAVKALVKIIEAEEDCHCCLETLAFTDEYDGERDDCTILKRLDAKTVAFDWPDAKKRQRIDL